ncbi:uncharacterized protein LOC120080784 [Benincasa hispida]|uniref:uncharacterized protein LOC120080784 n=1 Tax=Benincasa hispida TaxID=102211 RepID=UPI001900E776|nr:uncharacterized protein LOC120080784 [Benincasa hispida]XP_038891341.1 uncharacterized protein LOC120080784 [Benincasa hispida]
MAQQTTNVRLKLLIDTEKRSVLYGEADKDFIDFLFNLLSLPLGAVIRLLTKQHMIGCLGNLYESIETLNETCFIKPRQSKETLLRPKVSLNCSTKLLPYIIDQTSSSSIGDNAPNSSTWSHGCSSFGAHSTTLSDSCSLFGAASSTSSFCFSTIPPSSFSLGSLSSGFSSIGCSSTPIESGSTRCEASSSSGGGGLKVGFVKGLATYIVMDDLTVKHISDFSIVSLFRKFNIKDAYTLEEKVITLNVDEGVELLRAALQSKMVLTDVFLRRERQIIDNYNDDERP